MKLSLWVRLTDLLPKKKTAFDILFIDTFIYRTAFHKNSPYDVLFALKKYGVTGIELLIPSNTTNNDIKKVSQMVEKLNLHVFSIHQPLTSFLKIGIDEVTYLFKIANKLSAQTITLHSDAIGNKFLEKGYIESLKLLEKKYNIKIGIENMPKAWHLLLKTYTWKTNEFSNLMKKTAFHITFDTTHLAQTGKDITEFYKDNKDRIINIHLSDYKKHFLNKKLLLTNYTHLPLGHGELPIKEFLKTLKENNYDGLITMEISGSVDDLCQSARLIKSVF